MKKYFVSYRYLIGNDENGKNLYEPSSAILMINMDDIKDVYDLAQLILENEMSYAKSWSPPLDRYNIEIITCNRI